MTTTSGLATKDSRSTGVARERTGIRWENKAGSASSLPTRVVRVTSVQDVVDAVRHAAINGEQVHASGAGYALTGIAAAPGVMIDTTDLRGMVRVDDKHGTATFLAGTTVNEANAELRKYGATMVGAPGDGQTTLGGAVSTGAHGYAPREASFSALVYGLTVVTGEGKLLEITERLNSHYFPAARLSLGAIGVIAEVTVEFRRNTALRISRKRRNIERLISDIPEARAKTDFYRIDWRPHTDQAMLTVGWLEDEVAAIEAATRKPELETKVAAAAAKPRKRARFREKLAKFLPFLAPVIDRAANMFERTGDEGLRLTTEVSGDADHGLQVEYQFPAARARDVVAEVGRLVTANKAFAAANVRISLVAADGVWLSPAYGQDVVAVCLQLPGHFDAANEAALRETENLFIDLGGLPNWGGWHTLNGAEAAYVMPRYSDFGHIRSDLDPHGRTDNTALNRLLKH
ncbi:FAD-binding protein [Gulosibacter molinativorax]|uniref:FAD-binding protein n=1 Tax=Gulosibacter molinativorax TaxID=256821 RepID=A0ABT7CDK7_9MICO|nr:FAD-binding protein [Gulosibacter molinativorax]MDJ1372541.1 FAD-binding protein [Gulosibacter molinativorax]QUY62604.1 Hypotetical protein [Gulosibacter molinativorax]